MQIRRLNPPISFNLSAVITFCILVISLWPKKAELQKKISPCKKIKIKNSKRGRKRIRKMETE
jgi:hypothetical protein